VTDVVIDNPILNSPYAEPSRHFRFSDERITDEIPEGQRRSGYFVPVPAARTRQRQLQIEAQWTEDPHRVREAVHRRDRG
jgi:type III restriction enzyme